MLPLDIMAAKQRQSRGGGLQKLLRMLRSVPLVRDRIIPSLLEDEFHQLPGAPIAQALTTLFVSSENAPWLEGSASLATAR